MHEAQDTENRFNAIGEELRRAGRIGKWHRLSPGETNGLGLLPGAAGTAALVEGLSRHCRVLRDGGKFEAMVTGGDYWARYAPEPLDLTKKPMPSTYPAALSQVKQSERAWAGGRRSYAAHVIREAAHELGVDVDTRRPEAVIARLLAEREAAVTQLEDLCHNFGDDDWTPDLYLPDIIDKHLGKYLHAHAARSESQGSRALAPKPGRELGEKLLPASEPRRTRD